MSISRRSLSSKSSDTSRSQIATTRVTRSLAEEYATNTFMAMGPTVEEFSTPSKPSTGSIRGLTSLPRALQPRSRKSSGVVKMDVDMDDGLGNLSTKTSNEFLAMLNIRVTATPPHANPLRAKMSSSTTSTTSSARPRITAALASSAPYVKKHTKNISITTCTSAASTMQVPPTPITPISSKAHIPLHRTIGPIRSSLKTIKGSAVRGKSSIPMPVALRDLDMNAKDASPRSITKRGSSVKARKEVRIIDPFTGIDITGTKNYRGKENIPPIRLHPIAHVKTERGYTRASLGSMLRPKPSLKAF